MIPILAKRDFLSRVKSGGYIITTVLGILVFVGITFVPPLLQYLETSLFAAGDLRLLVYEQPGAQSFLPFLLEVSESRNIDLEDAGDLSEREAFRRVLAEGLNGLLLIDPPLYTLVAQDASNMGVNTQIEGLINSALTRANAEKLGLSESDMVNLFQRAELRIRQVDAHSEAGVEIDQASHTQSLVLAYLLLFMIYMALILYGNMVASGVAVEKSSRIMEVMVATVHPLELMMGKIIGIGALGLLQFAIWMAVAVGMSALSAGGMFGKMAELGFSLGSIPLSSVLWFGLFFFLGFFFYASIFAAAGAVVSRVEEVSQVVTLIMMFIIVGFFAAFLSFTNPNSTFAVIASFIPFTAPMVMFARMVLTDPPALQVAASILVLLVSVVGGAWLSSKIYRLGVLLYGKRPGVRQIVSLLREGT
ncbi:MAG TPA: ABC transporter permease [Firmicutes bacterium]|nr:ABC transporter permease [Bacillota bacterium]